MSNSCHVEILTSLLELHAPRVLELRPRFGSIGGALKRLWNAEVWGLPLFEGQQLINERVYGHHVDHLLDYDHFDVPYDGAFDLIVANHMVTHAVRPGDMLRVVKDRLAPDGYLYLYNEPDDAEFLDLKQSMFNVLNPFHFQTFDRDALVRALGLCGFETLFVTHERGNLVLLAKHRSVDAPVPSFTAEEVERRLARYRTARDLAILRVPEPVRPRFADEWDQVVDRAFASGLAELTSGGKLRVLKQSDADSHHELI
jgi:SAM-dependent methyltransferase